VGSSSSARPATNPRSRSSTGALRGWYELGRGRRGGGNVGAITAEEVVIELASHYPMSFSAVQKHIAILERTGLVTKERVGRRKVVHTNLERLRFARRLLDE